MIKNLFAITPEERAAYLRQMAELMGVLSDWELLASVREQVEPYFPVVAGRIAERLRHHPLTQQIQDVTQALTAIAQVYFARPTLDAEYLERRARAGRAYLEAGFSTGTLVAGIYGLWVDEWTRVFSELFHEDPGLLARLNRALALVSLYNLGTTSPSSPNSTPTKASSKHGNWRNVSWPSSLRPRGLAESCTSRWPKRPERSRA